MRQPVSARTERARRYSRRLSGVKCRERPLTRESMRPTLRPALAVLVVASGRPCPGGSVGREPLTVEQRLSGGNTGGAVRIGDTVRRAAGPWTPAVHALLQHLEAVGFAGAPRAHGFDEQGREVLTYLPGE